MTWVSYLVNRCTYEPSEIRSNDRLWPKAAIRLDVYSTAAYDPKQTFDITFAHTDRRRLGSSIDTA
jgi:hypothetical protein